MGNFFDVKRIKTKEYPAGTFNNLSGWLIDQRRAENFEKFGEHFTSKYYISFVWQLPDDLEEQGKKFFYKDSTANKPKKSKSFILFDFFFDD